MQLDSFFSSFDLGFLDSVFNTRSQTYVKELDNECIVEIDMPGVIKNDVTIKIVNTSTFLVEYKKKNIKNQILCSIDGQRYDLEKAIATIDLGVLFVKVPVHAQNQVKYIKIV